MSAIPHVWPTFLKLGCVTNFDTLFLVMRFICLVDEMKSMLISSRHFFLTDQYAAASGSLGCGTISVNFNQASFRAMNFTSMHCTPSFNNPEDPVIP